MAAKTDLRGEDRDSPGLPSSTPGAKASHRGRLIALVIGLLAVGGGALYLRADDLRERWLVRQSLADLKTRATKNDPLASLIYVEALVKAGRSSDGLNVMRDAVAALPPNASGPIVQRLLSRFGHDLALNGYLEDALENLKRAQKLDPDDPRVYNGLALVFLSQKQPDAAEKQLKLSTGLAPDNAEAWYLLGKMYNDTRRPESALEPLKKSVKLSSNFAASHAELGHAYAFQAQFGPAVEEFRKALSMEPEHIGYRRALGAALGMAARSPEQYDEAKKLLDEALKEDPTNEPMIYSLGQLHLRFNHLEEAQARLKQSLSLNPSNAEAWYNLSLVQKRLGDDAAYKVSNAKFQYYTKLHDDAVIAEKKVAADLKNGAVRIELARAYQRAGNLVGTYWQMRVALQINPNQPALAQEFKSVAKTYEAYRAKAGGKPDNPQDMGPPPPGTPDSGAAPGTPTSAPPPASTPTPDPGGPSDDR